MQLQSVIIHERLANWSRQLRPSLRGLSIDWSESRSTASLVAAVTRMAFPILVIDIDGRPSRGLEDLDAALLAAPTTLSLVLERQSRADVAAMARELGATLVLTGVVVPPEVEVLIRRWLPLARQRAESGGWTRPLEPELEPWERPELFLFPDLPRGR